MPVASGIAPAYRIMFAINLPEPDNNGSIGSGGYRFGSGGPLGCAAPPPCSRADSGSVPSTTRLPANPFRPNLPSTAGAQTFALLVADVGVVPQPGSPTIS